jgi:cytochrome oxidase Cu insertion factor (SCO1/SenC/PrrC family)
VTRHRALLALSILFLVAASCDRGGTNFDAPGEGDRAPTFTLPSASGEQVELSDFAGEKPALLYFSMGPG